MKSIPHLDKDVKHLFNTHLPPLSNAYNQIVTKCHDYKSFMRTGCLSLDIKNFAHKKMYYLGANRRKESNV